VVRQLAALGSLGEVLDVATGRGQLALLLVETGQAARLSGMDWDERKIELLRDAAGDAGRVFAADLRTTELPTADTVLLIDVLHYLSAAEQRELLAHAVAATRPGGRVIVRELDPARGLASWVAIWAERIGTRMTMNRGAVLELVEPAALERELESLGTTTRRLPHPDGKTSPNYCVVAERSTS